MHQLEGIQSLPKPGSEGEQQLLAHPASCVQVAPVPLIVEQSVLCEQRVLPAEPVQQPLLQSSL
jgi:hypothetical protein